MSEFCFYYTVVTGVLLSMTAFFFVEPSNRHRHCRTHCRVLCISLRTGCPDITKFDSISGSYFAVILDGVHLSRRATSAPDTDSASLLLLIVFLLFLLLHFVWIKMYILQGTVLYLELPDVDWQRYIDKSKSSINDMLLYWGDGAVSSPSGVRGGAPIAKRICLYLNAPDSFSCNSIRVHTLLKVPAKHTCTTLYLQLR